LFIVCSPFLLISAGLCFIHFFFLRAEKKSLLFNKY
jgi:hypothetical protein